MNTESLINEKIAYFYGTNRRKSSENINGSSYFNKDKSLNFPKIYNEVSKVNNWSEDQNYDFYKECFENLSPVYWATMEFHPQENLMDMKLDWLGENVKFLRIKQLQEAPTAVIENVLLLTSLLENGLGNVFYTKTEGRIKPPHLLRDLLKTKELIEVFGEETIFFLKVLLGTPNSINLRNILWHGFPKPNEIPSFYVSLMLITIHSLGSILEEVNFSKILQRQQITNFDGLLNPIADQLNLSLKFPESNEIECHLKYFTWPSADYVQFWIQLCRYFECQDYMSFVILILPQIELLLRIIYGKVNDYDISAKLDEYYITMDTILESHVPNNDIGAEIQINKLFTPNPYASEGILNLIYDLFMSPDGPRIRDKVSHGEDLLSALQNQNLSKILFYLAMCLVSSESQSTFSLPEYQSAFHKNRQTKGGLSEALKIATSFSTKHKFPSKMEASNFHLILEKNVSIFKRHKKEVLYMNLIHKITLKIMETYGNFIRSLEVYEAFTVDRSLHSRRRKTYENLLQALPDFSMTLENILDCLLIIFHRLQSDEHHLDGRSMEKILKYLKHTLKVAENFAKYSHKDSNEWIKLRELCTNYMTIKRLYFFFDLNE